MAMFERDTEIYRDRDALREDYQPKEVVARSEELEAYQSALQPVINGEQPNNIFLYGKTGVGKTVTTRYLLNHLREDADQYDDISLTVVSLNCDGLNSSYQVATHLVNQLREEHEQISTTGYPLAAVYDKLWSDLEALDGTVLVVLDEIDNIQDDSILYQLPRARDNGNLEETKLGLIGISNDFEFRDQLSSKVKSSLCEEELHFPAYDASELQEILKQRIDVAFQSGVVDGAVISYCAAIGARDAGDARQSIELLMKGGDLARKENSSTVEEDHVRRGEKLLERSRVAEGISGLTPHGRYILYALVTLHLEGETPVRTRDIRPRYTHICQNIGDEPLVPRRMRDHLGDLTMLGIADVTERNEGRRGGKYREYTLKTDTETVVKALDETISEVGVHQALAQAGYADVQTTLPDAARQDN
jgi:cell division control protein 6